MPMQSGAGYNIQPSFKATTTTGKELSLRIDQEVQKKNLADHHFHSKKNIPASIGMDSLPKVPITQLPISFSRPPQLEAHLSGSSGYSDERLKLPEHGIPRPYWDPKVLLPRKCESRSLILMGGRLREFAKEWMGITHNPIMFDTIQGHLLQFNQKPS